MMALAALFCVTLLVPQATAVITPTAQCTCLPNGLPRDSSGQVQATGGRRRSGGKLGGTYGDSCGQQPETFHHDCVNSTGHPLANPASWCGQAWCWVDPCTCKLPDVAKSAYFTANIYYSYSNCGGNDTYTTAPQTTATCSVYDSTPVNSCQPRMANDYPLIACNDSFAIMGQCRNASVSGTYTNYPSSYGEGCGIHLEPGASACSHANGTAKAWADQTGWCKQAWTYVNVCECSASDLAKSSYFPGLYYSYSACGGTDSYTTTTMNATLTAEAVCPSPPPPPATLPNPGNYPGSNPAKKMCACQPFPASIPLVDCNTSFAQSGKCVNATKFPGYYPANYGTTCGVHIEPLTASCFDLSTGTPWKSPCRGDKTSGCRASWCDVAWCWVDPCTCNGPTDMAPSTWFPGNKMFYSYSNCDGVDTFTSSGEAAGGGVSRSHCPLETCQHVVDAYSNANCCGQPSKMMGATGLKCVDVRKAYQKNNCCDNLSAPFYPTIL